MKKLLLISILLFGTLLQARIVNAIAIVVDGEPITTAEIRAVQKQLNVSKKEAENMLIDNRLQKAAMKDITVSEDEVDKGIERIAQQNGMSVKKMQGILKKQGQSWNKFRDQVKGGIKKQKFFRSNIAPTIAEPTTDELKIFYKHHQELFSQPSSITVMEYSASTPDKIQKMLRNPGNQKGISHTKRTLTGSDITPQLLAMLSHTAVGKFTPAFNNGNKYITYKILNRGKGTAKPFDKIKKDVIIAWKRDQQGNAVKRYFEKRKKSATIEYLRR